MKITSTRLMSFLLIFCLAFGGTTAMACGVNHSPSARQDINWNPGNFGG